MRSVSLTCVPPTDARPWRSLMDFVPGRAPLLRCSEKLPSVGLISPIVPWMRLPVETSRWYAASEICKLIFIMCVSFFVGAGSARPEYIRVCICGRIRAGEPRPYR